MRVIDSCGEQDLRRLPRMQPRHRNLDEPTRLHGLNCRAKGFTGHRSGPLAAGMFQPGFKPGVPVNPMGSTRRRHPYNP